MAVMEPIPLIGHGTEAWIPRPDIGTTGMIHLYVLCEKHTRGKGGFRQYSVRVLSEWQYNSNMHLRF